MKRSPVIPVAQLASGLGSIFSSASAAALAFVFIPVVNFIFPARIPYLNTYIPG